MCANEHDCGQRRSHRIMLHKSTLQAQPVALGCSAQQCAVSRNPCVRYIARSESYVHVVPWRLDEVVEATTCYDGGKT